LIQEEKNMDKYECSICGYIYDEAEQMKSYELLKGVVDKV
jgi:ribosomal protein L37E